MSTANSSEITLASSGTFAQQLLNFVRSLRNAGVPIGSAQVIDALSALTIIDMGKRDDFYWALAAILVGRKDHRALFDAVFRQFWYATSDASFADDEQDQEVNPALQNPAAQLHLHAVSDPTSLEQLGDGSVAELAYSAQESLRKKDFAELSDAELREVQRLLANVTIRLQPKATRRWHASNSGTRIDWRATVRANATGKCAEMKRRKQVTHVAPLVAICDISRSMERYTAVFLHFLHAIYANNFRVHAFLFGTRLSNVSRPLARRDAARAIADISKVVGDWAGGTRIGASLHDFNRDWSRRVLGRNAVVLLVTDGLERDDGELLRREAERLHKSCARLIWLNPLLRYEQFQAKAGGIRALLPNVDDFLPMHNFASFAKLSTALRAG